MKDLNTYDLTALIIVLVGGINWGLIGLVNLNLVLLIFGVLLSRLIYIIIGVAAGYICYSLYKEKKTV